MIEGCNYAGADWIRSKWEGKDWWHPKRPALTFEQWKSHARGCGLQDLYQEYLNTRLKRYGVSGVDKTMSPLGVKAADLLGQVWQGIYHLDQGMLMRVNWSNKIWVAVSIYESISTFDDSRLTHLVVEAHDRCLRLAIRPHGRQMGLMFHERQPEGDVYHRHPTLEDNVARLRGFRDCHAAATM